MYVSVVRPAVRCRVTYRLTSSNMGKSPIGFFILVGVIRDMVICIVRMIRVLNGPGQNYEDLDSTEGESFC